MRPITRRTALMGVVAAGLAACSKDEPAPSTPTVSAPPVEPSTTPTPSSSPTPVDSRPRWPLTGKLKKNTEDGRHAAVAVKVPDNKFEHPQRGINEADIVFVELEGYKDASGYSATRLVPVFHSEFAESVEPVRSIRPVDIPLLSPMNAIIGNTGAAKWVVNYVKHYRRYLEGMLSYMNTRGTGSYGTDPSRVYTYQGQTYYDRATVCHPEVLGRQTKRFRDGPQGLYFPFATRYDSVSTEQGKRGRSVTIPYKGDDYFMGYTYDKASKRYLRSEPWGPHVLADGKRVTIDNVLIIKAKQSYGKVYRGGGHDEPLHDIIDAKGTFYYFNRGRYVKGTWSKGRVNHPFTFTLADGSPLHMRPGRTFVELPDDGAKIRVKP